MGALLAMGNDVPTHSCPFCRSTTEASTDEYVLAVLDRTYLVSTSRVHGANSEGLQTIHVLKDITDRREAERRQDPRRRRDEHSFDPERLAERAFVTSSQNIDATRELWKFFEAHAKAR